MENETGKIRLLCSDNERVNGYVSNLGEYFSYFYIRDF